MTEIAGIENSVAVVMAGGSGTRFWPLSRASRPKQYLPLAGDDKSLIQATVDRLHGVVARERIMVVTTAEQVELVNAQLPGITVLPEPCTRNTAPCLALAAAHTLATFGDVPMLCVPADHLIDGEPKLAETLRAGLRLAADEEVLITIGITPTAPETGYGYIKTGDPAPGAAGITSYKVAAFVEKPDTAAAREYFASGEYYWNSGMFIWRSGVFLKAVAELVPSLAPLLHESAHKLAAPEFAALYQTLPSVPVDVAVMERAKNVRMFPGTGFAWSDVGSWRAWAEIQARSAESGDAASGAAADVDNVVIGDGMFVGSRGCTFLQSESAAKRKFFAGVGLEDLVIVETADALLVCSRERSQEVRQIVEALKKTERNELL